MNKRRKGISLIVLVITILVMLILSGVVIVSLSKNNPVEKAKEATFKTDMQTFLDDLSLFFVNKISEDSTFDKTSLIADSKTCVYNTQKVGNENNIGDIISGVKNGKYANKIEVVQGSLYFVEPSKTEQKWLLEMGILFKGKESGNILIEGDTLVGVSPGYVNTGVLIIPEIVKKIAPGAFLGCNGIFQVIIPKTVTSIPEDCFRNCSNLSKVILPETIKSIQNRAFMECEKLEHINFPNSINEIWTDAFLRCRSLKEVRFSDNLVSVGYRAFQECVNLTKVTFNNKLQNLYGLAFRNAAITEAVLPDSLVTLGDQVFLECNKLSKLHIGKNTTVIGSGIVRNCTNLNALTVSSENPSYTAVDNILYTKDKTKLLMVPANKSSITFPKELKRIGFLAFASNTELSKIDVPEGVTYIEGNAFSETNITSLSIPSTVTEIEPRVIEGARNLTTINVSNGNPYFTFVDGVLLKNLSGEFAGKKKTVAMIDSKTGVYTIPSDVVEIGSFSLTGRITEVVIPNGVKTIGNYALYTSNITEVTIPDSVTMMYPNAFSLCRQLVTVKIGSGITSIPDGAFYSCYSLKNLELGSNVSTFGNQCFAFTRALDNITIVSGNINLYTDGKYIYSADKTRLLAASNKDANYVVPSTVTEIADYVFSENDVITNITIPNGVTKLGRQFVHNTPKLTKLVLPASISSIHAEAFGGAASIQELVIQGGKSEASLPGSPWGLPKGKFAVKWK